MMMKTITGANVMYVNDVENLSQEQCKQLKAGDKVIAKDGTDEVLYLVNYVNDSEIDLIYVSNDDIVIIYYVKNDGVWEYEDTIIRDFSQFTFLYEHTIELEMREESPITLNVITNSSISITNNSLGNLHKIADAINDVSVVAFITAPDGLTGGKTKIMFASFTSNVPHFYVIDSGTALADETAGFSDVLSISETIKLY